MYVLSVSTWRLLLEYKMERGGGSEITYLLNGDDDMRHHRLDDVPSHRHLSSVELLTWCVVVVGGG